MKTNRGFIKWIIILVVILLIMSYYGISLRALVNNPTTQDNISYVATSSVSIWDQYLKQPATYLYNQVFISLIWNPAIDNLTKMKNGEPTNVQTSAPQLPVPVLQPN